MILVALFTLVCLAAILCDVQRAWALSGDGRWLVGWLKTASIRQLGAALTCLVALVAGAIYVFGWDVEAQARWAAIFDLIVHGEATAVSVLIGGFLIADVVLYRARLRRVDSAERSDLSANVESGRALSMGIAGLSFVFIFSRPDLGSTITVIHYSAVALYLWLLFWPLAAKADSAGRESHATRRAWRPRGYFLVAFYIWLYMGFTVPGDDALVGWPVPPAAWPIAGLTVVIASFPVASWRPGRRPRGRLGGGALLSEVVSSSARAIGLVAIYAAIVIDATVAGAPRPSIPECLTVIGLAFLGCALGSIAAAIAADPSNRLVDAMAGAVRKPIRATLVELGIIAIVALFLLQGGVNGNSVGLFSTAFIAQFALRAMAFRAASSPPATVVATTP